MLLALEEYLDARPPAEARRRPRRPRCPGPRASSPRRPRPPKPAAVAPGGEFEVELTLTIKDGYHIYANPAGSDDVIPTVVTLAPARRPSWSRSATRPASRRSSPPAGRARSTVYEKKATADGPGPPRRRRQGRARRPSSSGSATRPATTGPAWPRPPWTCR